MSNSFNIYFFSVFLVSCFLFFIKIVLLFQKRRKKLIKWLKTWYKVDIFFNKKILILKNKNIFENKYYFESYNVLNIKF